MEIYLTEEEIKTLICWSDTIEYGRWDEEDEILLIKLKEKLKQKVNGISDRGPFVEISDDEFDMFK